MLLIIRSRVMHHELKKLLQKINQSNSSTHLLIQRQFQLKTNSGKSICHILSAEQICFFQKMKELRITPYYDIYLFLYFLSKNTSMKVKFINNSQSITPLSTRRYLPQHSIQRQSILLSSASKSKKNIRVLQSNLKNSKKKPTNHKTDNFRSKHILHHKSSTAISIVSSIGSLKSIDLEKFQSLKEYQKSALKEYLQLAELYESNQWKLIQIINKELNDKKYLYGVQILEFLKNPIPESLKRVNHNMFKIEIQKLTDFLTEFNAKKKLKKIEIIKESMEKRQKMIRNSAKCQQYYDMYEFIRSPYKMNQGMSVYDQLRFISEADYSLIPKQNIDVLENVYKKIRKTEEQMYLKIKTEAIQRKSRNEKMMGIQPGIR